MSALTAALALLCAVWVGPHGAVLHQRIQRLGGARYLAGVSEHIDLAANLAGVPVEVYAALVREESSFDPSTVSPVGAAGLAQLMPGTVHFREWRRVCELTPRDCRAAGLIIGARHLARMYEICGADWELAISRYRGNDCVPTKRAKHTLETARLIRVAMGGGS
jgi:hypothetical protein